MPKTADKKRTRLSPEVRKSMILERAAELIAAEGVSAVNMERIGRDIGVSKALVYSYFPSPTELLQTLLVHEYKHLRALQLEAAESAETFEQLVRRITNVYLSYIEDRGLILDRLAAEPSVADHGDPTAFSRDTASIYLGNIFAETFDMDTEIALGAVDISFGLPAAAGNLLSKSNLSRDTIEDLTVTMIIGSLESVRNKYETAFKRLKGRSSNDKKKPG